MPTARDIAATFISYLKEQGQEDQLETLVGYLQEELYRNHDITVISATELDQDERSALEKKLTATWGEHRIIISVDPTIVSGMIVRFRDTLIDLSGKHQLEGLAQEFRS